MIKLFCIILVFSNAFAAYYTVEDIENIEQKNKSKLKAVNESEPTTDLIAVVLPQNLYTYDLYLEELNDTEVAELVNETKGTQPNDEFQIAVEEVFDFTPNISYLSDDPEFKINTNVSIAAITVNSTNSTLNNTEPEKSLLEKLERGVDMKASGSAYIALAYTSVIMAFLLMVN